MSEIFILFLELYVFYIGIVNGDRYVWLIDVSDNIYIVFNIFYLYNFCIFKVY